MKQLILDISPIPNPSLDNFVVGRNAELLQLLHIMVDLCSPERFVYLWGEPASGKSHLLQAVAGGVAAHGANAIFLDTPTQADLVPDPLEGYIVVVDNVDKLDEDAQIALFNLYNRTREGQGMLLVSGPCAPAQLSLRQDLVTRLGWGLVYQVHGLSDEEKVEALKTHAKERGFELAREVADYLLRHWRRDMPSLLAMLDALDRYSLQTKRPVTLPLLRQVLQPDTHV